MQIESFVAKLEGARKAGDHYYARCPAHEDSQASLSIALGSKGGIVVKCHAGCPLDAVLERLQLKSTDLAPDRAPRAAFVATYDYVDEHGELVYQVVRDANKKFLQRRPDGAGGWLWKVEGVRKLLYRLPDLVAADAKVPVFIPEGEKDVDNVRKLGLVATTGSGGAGPGKWRAFVGLAVKILAGRHVVVLPDNDDVGRTHARDVAASLDRVAASVRMLELPGLAEHGDVSDWISAGGTSEKLLELARSAPKWVVGSRPAPGPNSRPLLFDDRRHHTPVLVRMADVEPEDVQWCWGGRIPWGKMTLADGDPGLGKSTMSCEIAARGSRGEALPGDAVGQVFATLMISAEDGIRDTIVRRLRVANADVNRVIALTEINENDGRPPRMPSLQSDVHVIEQAVETLKAEFGRVLIIVDPLMAFLGSTDSFKDSEVRRTLAPLAAMAERTGSALLLVRHLNKGSGSALHRGGGSIGISGAARSVLLVTRDPDDDDARILAPVKNNLARMPPALRFRLVSAGSCARVEWLGEVNITADQLVAPVDPNNADRGQLGEARAWLEAHLADGPQRARVMFAAAKRDGFSEPTIKRAKALLDIVSRKEIGSKGEWAWALKGKGFTRGGHPPDTLDTHDPLDPLGARSPGHGDHGDHQYQEDHQLESRKSDPLAPQTPNRVSADTDPLDPVDPLVTKQGDQAQLALDPLARPAGPRLVAPEATTGTKRNGTLARPPRAAEFESLANLDDDEAWR